MAMEHLTLTVLCENSAGPARGVLGEHGWAVLIETPGGNLLFDTGGKTILDNSRALGIDLKQLDLVVLSHGHYDHAGGLADVLAATGPVDVMLHPEAFRERYACKDENKRDIGIRFKKSYLESLGARFRPVTEFVEIIDDIYLTGEIPRLTPFETPDPQLMVPGPGGRLIQDMVVDDQALVIDTVFGLVIVLGCAHSGIINTLTHIGENMPGRALHLVLGGTHLGFASEEQFTATSYLLAGYDIAHLGTAHCTGLVNGARLQARMGDRVFFAAAGTRITLPLAASSLGSSAEET